MALILALLGCGERPRTPVPRCAELDFAVVLGSSVPDRVSHVVPLPDGDVLLAGYYAGAPAVAPGGPPLPVGYGARDGFVARVSPDGDVRWQHGFGGSEVDQVTAVATVAGQVLVSTWFGGVEVFLDSRPIPNTAGVAVDVDAGWLRFDLDTGELNSVGRLGQDAAQYATGITGDGDGNTYVVGHFTALRLTVGPWTHDNPSEDGHNYRDQAFLTSFGPDGTPRWLTTWGGVSVDEPEGVAWLGDHLVVGGTWLTDPVEALASDGTAHPLTPGVLDLLSFDPETGLPVGELLSSSGLVDSSLLSLAQAGEGRIVMTGSTSVGQTWSTGDGTTHAVPPSPSGNPYPWFRAKLDAAGELTEWWSDDALVFGASPTRAPMAVAGWANTLHDPDGSVAFDPPPISYGHDGMAATFDADDHLTCAWLFAGDDDESALDAAFDARGGLWVVGEFSEHTLVTNSEGETVAEWTADGSTDGFVLRFRGVSDP